ncbi:MAG: hypothetical protein ACXABY_08800 [Candidatus Thorarchaeota archaeon]|jgi:hypothetical protein
MGYMQHHAILVTTWNSDAAEDIHEKVVEIIKAHKLHEEMVSTLSGVVVNGYRSFAVFPDGSKEGWDTSENGEEARDAIVEMLETYRYEDGSTAMDWVEVQYGDDNLNSYIVRHSDEEERMEVPGSED